MKLLLTVHNKNKPEEFYQVYGYRKNKKDKEITYWLSCWTDEGMEFSEHDFFRLLNKFFAEEF